MATLKPIQSGSQLKIGHRLYDTGGDFIGTIKTPPKLQRSSGLTGKAWSFHIENSDGGLEPVTIPDGTNIHLKFSR